MISTLYQLRVVETLYFPFCDAERRAAAAAADDDDVDDDDDDVMMWLSTATRNRYYRLGRRLKWRRGALWRALRLLINADNDFKASSRDVAPAPANCKTSCADEAQREQGARPRSWRDAGRPAATPLDRVELAFINALYHTFYCYLVQNRLSMGG